ncbi:2-dehydropantoate 2-reductase [Lactovum miscens]|uniref:2-dehydropantoate 2-reductase n=1 Tax=Lactovum miscens TaxID=190387 RepID=A0A841C7Z3_9LACT|nr:2-dehydropantoate 2-reductase [Lactovum miscens]MBB5887360.1 2-dehydropantoate 2-reductase [Lactovum miscens]
MKIAIAGAGAMGSRFALMLAQAGNNVLMIDGWQAHIDAIKANGLQANYNGEEVVVKIPIVSQTEVPSDEKFELIILFTKAMQLESMLQSIKGIIDQNTKVLCLLNGIGHEDIIEKFVPMENIFIGNTMWTAGLEGPGKAKLFGEGYLELQNLGENSEDNAKEIADVLSEAKLDARYSENIRYSIYKKACVNGTMNGLCTLLDANMASVGATSTIKVMCQLIVKEFASVADKEGVKLNQDEVLELIYGSFNPETIGLHYPSMHQDLIKNKRLTEIDYINGVISRKGIKYGIPTPYCDFLTQLIHAKEEIMEAK